jgi:hypothetical protein
MGKNSSEATQEERELPQSPQIRIQQMIPAGPDDWAISYQNTVEEPGVISWESASARRS